MQGRVGVVLVLVLPTSLATELPAAKSKSYVGQDFGELSRVAVLVGGRWFLGAQRSGGEPLAANLLICYLIKRLPGSGVRTEEICGYLPPPPLFLKPRTLVMCICRKSDVWRRFSNGVD
jgi:hypothetical protein